MKKLFFGIFFFLTLFVFKSFSSSQALAVEVYVTGSFINAGPIDVNVTARYFDANGQFGRTLTFPVPAWHVNMPTSDADLQFTGLGTYKVKWSTECTDPDVSADTTLSSQDGTFYWFMHPDINVLCTTPNTTPYITSVACHNVNWDLTGIGSGGVNIDHFDVYFSKNSSLLGGPGVDPYGVTPFSAVKSARSYDFGSQQDGTYYTRIRAVSPQGIGSWSSVGNFTCTSDVIPVQVSPATNLTTSAFCGNGVTNYKAGENFSWAPATGMTFVAQYLDYSVNNNGFASGYNGVNVGVGASSYSIGTGLIEGVRFYWRINTQDQAGNWHSSGTAQFDTASCPDDYIPPASAAPSSGPTCPAGCTAPSGTVPSWTQPTGYAEFIDTNNWTTISNCSSTDTSCTASGFTSGHSVAYDVRYKNSSGVVIKSTTVKTANSNGKVKATWSWDYAIAVWRSSYIGYLDDPDAVPPQSVSDSTSSVTFNNLKANTTYKYNVCTPNCGNGNNVAASTFTTGSCNCPSPTPRPSPVPYVTINPPTSSCTAGVSTVQITWTSNTRASNYYIYKKNPSGGWDDVTSTGTPSSLGSSARSWTSGAQPSSEYNTSHYWKVQDSKGYSDQDSVTTATCMNPPTDPTNLQVTPGCDSNGPTLMFSWTAPSNASSGNVSGYWLDVNGAQWTSDTGPSPWAVKTINNNGSGTISFTWSGSSALDSGDVDPVTSGNQLVPDRGKTYYWRLEAFGPGGSGTHVYPPGTEVLTNVSPAVSNSCRYDLQVSLVPGYVNTPAAGTNLTAQVHVVNLSGTVGFGGLKSDSSSPTFSSDGAGGVPIGIGVWPKTNTMPPPSLPNCSGYTGSGGQTPTSGNGYALSSLNLNSSQEVSISFNVGTVPGTYIAQIFAIPSCAAGDVFWGDATHQSNSVSLTYNVDVKAWFETKDGDVGAAGNVSVGQSSSALNRYQSNFLMAGNQVESGIAISPTGWKLRSYNKPLVPTGGVYKYMAERFLKEAQKYPVAANIPAGNRVGYNWVNGSATFQASNGPNGNPVIYFIEGDLTINNDLILASGDSAIFLVSGNIIVQTGVKKIEGVYIAGGDFRDTTTVDGSTDLGSQLVVNGALYAKSFSLRRKLGGVSCSGPCLNATDPAEQINYQPKYVIALKDLLGSPAISWKEVAP